MDKAIAGPYEVSEIISTKKRMDNAAHPENKVPLIEFYTVHLNDDGTTTLCYN